MSKTTSILLFIKTPGAIPYRANKGRTYNSFISKLFNLCVSGKRLPAHFKEGKQYL